MSATFTPREDIKDGDLVKLTGADWGAVNMESEVRTVVGAGFEARVRDQFGHEWYIMDPVVYRSGVADWSVTRVDDLS